MRGSRYPYLVSLTNRATGASPHVDCRGVIVGESDGSSVIVTCKHVFRLTKWENVTVHRGKTRFPIRDAQEIPTTDIAVVRVEGYFPTPAGYYPPVATTAPTVGLTAVTFGASTVPGTVIGRVWASRSKETLTVVRGGLVIATHPPSRIVHGDSGAPVVANGAIIGVQSQLIQFAGIETSFAVVSTLTAGMKAKYLSQLHLAE